VRVGIDGRSLAGPQDRGVRHVTHSLLAAAAAGFPADDFAVLVPGRAPWSPPPDLERSNVEIVRHVLPSRALFGGSAVLGRPRLDRLLGGVDVLWMPAPAPLAASSGVPLVLSVHDLSWAARPRDFTPYERLWHALARPARLARRATALTAVSRATAGEVERRWGIPAREVVVVPNGVELPRADPGALPPELPARYLLFVGALEPRKAPELLVEAFGRARSRGLDAELVLAGEGRLAPRLRAPGVRLLGRVPRGALASLYAGALALVMPSWLEGFGLPPAEALRAGTPAVVSDLPVFAEVLGEGALRVAPGDADALADALVRIAGDAELRARLAAVGAEAIRSLTWERAARELHAVLANARERPDAGDLA
jgi:glycosyltransferase involved in cell wall biosynthesis